MNFFQLIVAAPIFSIHFIPGQNSIKFIDFLAFTMALLGIYIQNRSNAVATRFYPMDITNMIGLVGYYRFEEKTGTVAINDADNSKKGTLTNSPTYSTETP